MAGDAVKEGADGSDTILSIGGRVECPHFEPSDQSGEDKPFCKHFQIHPKCGGDLNICDVLLNSPDPRDGYK